MLTALSVDDYKMARDALDADIQELADWAQELGWEKDVPYWETLDQLRGAVVHMLLVPYLKLPGVDEAVTFTEHGMPVIHPMVASQLWIHAEMCDALRTWLLAEMKKTK